MTDLTNELQDLAANLRWTWDRATEELLASLPGAAAGRHPMATLLDTDDGLLRSWIDEHAAEISTLHDELAEVIARVSEPKIAYFSPEFGVAAEVPQYSGGLGILAGDHLKSASDLHLPMVGIGLLYRQGFFRQELSAGRQQERIDTVDPESIGAEDTGHTVVIPIDGHDVVARVWRQMVGATQLLLLDTDVEANGDRHRRITDRLYAGDRLHRLHQELVLGVGGVRALRTLEIAPEVFHLNEGHACFLLLELLAEHIERGATLDAAVEAVRGATLFTTHTPVPAGIDRFDRTIIEPELELWAERLGCSTATLFEWAHLPTDEESDAGAPFNTAALAFELCGRANGVSQLHAEVSRNLFVSLSRASAVTGITNGVHARTWVHEPLQQLYDRQLGPGWDVGHADAWSRIGEVDVDALSAVHLAGRRQLVEMVAASGGAKLDPERCILGFARRFATYKRAGLMLRDRDGLRATLDAGAQFVFAGKAHPADDAGKAVLAEIVAFAESEQAQDQFVFLPDYDITVARTMYAGCDVWLNNPIRPQEACGTSGEKSALNGGLNCSILDGWWADWYIDGIGWAIPVSDSVDPAARDREESIALHRLLVEEVLPRFDRPADWWSTVVAMLDHLGPLVTAGRMVDEYDQRFYRPIREDRPG